MIRATLVGIVAGPVIVAVIGYALLIWGPDMEGLICLRT